MHSEFKLINTYQSVLQVKKEIKIILLETSNEEEAPL
jgi:hypothetical protein